MRASLRLLLVLGAVSRTALGVVPPEAARVGVGGVPDRVAESRDLGPADGDLPLSRVVLLLAPRDPAGLETFLARLQDPTCSEFHRWVSPEEFGRRFGAASENVERVSAWLSEQQLTVIGPNAGHTVLLFSGRLEDVAHALQTEFRNLEWNGEPHIANVTAPTIPRELSGFVRGVLSLDDFRRARPPVRSPLYTGRTGLHSLAPADFAAIYDLEPLYAAGIDGRGTTIAILGASRIDANDVELFRQTYGLPPADMSTVIVEDPGLDDSNGWQFEGSLDVEWAGAVAVSAKVVFVVSNTPFLPSAGPGPDLAALHVVDNDLADIISVSAAWCEYDSTPQYVAYWHNLWAQAAAQGISVLIASGDTGFLGCAGGFGLHSDVPSINGVGSSPYCTNVGGTQFTGDADSAYWNQTNDPVTKRSVKGPIPEIGWGGSGGGLSAVFARPAWQEVPGLAPGPNRAVPDVSLTASTHDAYLVSFHGAIIPVGGTSASAPAFAGIVALLEQKVGGRLGNLNPMLYALGRAQYGGGGAAAFRDVTVGDNSYGGQTGYQAGPGYDLVTGLGSVDAAALVNSFAISSGPVANFTFALAPHSEGRTVQFTDTSTGGPTSWSWVFGDGGISTLENPSHTLDKGTYQVSLTVSNSGGSSSKTQAVVVGLHHEIAQPPPIPFHPQKRPTL